MSVFRQPSLYLILAAAALCGCVSRSGASGPAEQSRTASKAPEVIRELAGTAWVLRDLDGELVDAAAAAGEPTWPSLLVSFGADGQSVAGHGGLNRFGGRYSQAGESLKFGPLAMTRRAGPPALMALERRYTQMLSRVEAWRQEGPRLILVTPGSKRAAVFEPAPADEVR